MSVEKPDVNTVWADDADPGDIFSPDIGGGSIPPSPGKTAKGWIGADIPPHQYFNYDQNRQGQFNKHVNIEGMPVWDIDTPYLLNSYAKDPDDGRIYRSLIGTEIAPNSGNKPSISATEWRKQIETEIEIVEAPINQSPANLSTIGTQKPTLVGSAYKSLYGLDHLDSEFRVARDAAMIDLSYLSGSVGPVLQHVLVTPLALDDDYWFDIRYRDSEGAWSDKSTPTKFTVPLQLIQTPTNLTPVNGDITITDEVTVTADAFSSIPVGIHAASQWQISSDQTFVSVDFDSGEDAVNLTDFTQAGLSLSTQYFWRVRYKETTQGFSAYSTPSTFTTVSATVGKPINQIPISSSTNIGPSAQLVADIFTVIGGAQTHDASQWQVASDSSFTNILFDSGEDSVNLESIIATGFLEGLITHYWRVRYKGSVTGFSQYSNSFNFVTSLEFADWSAWDGASDGIPVVYSSLLTSSGDVKANRILTEIGNGRFLSVYDTASNLIVQVLGTSGLSISSGGEVILNQSHDSSDPFPAVVKIGTDKVLIAWQKTSSGVAFIVATINNNSVTFGSELIAVDNIGGEARWFINRVEDDKVLFTYSINTASVSCKVLSISGTTITEGTKVDVHSSTVFLPPRCGSVDVLNKKGIIAYSPTSLALTVVGIDTALNIVTVLAQNTDNNIPIFGANTMFYAKWMNANAFLIGVVDGSSTTDAHHIFVGSYDGATTISALSLSQLAESATAQSRTGVAIGFAQVAPNEFIVFYKVELEGVFAKHITIFGGNAFYGPEITINTGSIEDNSYTDIKAIDDGRLLVTYDTGSFNLTAKILNGEVQ